MRKCFVQDNNAHWYSIFIELKPIFYNLNERHQKLLDILFSLQDNENSDNINIELDKSEKIFESLFGKYKLNMHISNYSFENLEEIREN